MNKFKLLVATGIFAISSAASAMPIVGEIAFTSSTGSAWSAVDAANADTTIALATGISFDGTGHVSNAIGTFAGTEGAVATFNDFQFDPLVAGTTLWSFIDDGKTYSLTMNEVSDILRGSSTLTVEGTGFLSATGYEDTFGRWDFSGNRLSWSSGAVPEPAMALLLATGLIGFGFARKMRKS